MKVNSLLIMDQIRQESAFLHAHHALIDLFNTSNILNIMGKIGLQILWKVCFGLAF